MKTNLATKALTLTVVIITMLLLTNLLIFMYAKWLGIEINATNDLLQLLADESHKGMVKLIIGLNHTLTFIVGPVFFLWIFYKGQIIKYLSLKHFNPIYLVLFPIALFTLYPLMGYLAYYVDQIKWPDFFNQMDNDSMAALAGILKMDSLGDLFINLLIVGILPGIGEELLFRGIIQKEMTQKWNKPHTAIWVTAIIFSAFHFQLAGFIPKMLIGVVLGYAYYFSGSLKLPMIIHAINNSYATIALFLAGGEINTEEINAENIPFISVLMSLLIFGMLMYYIRQFSIQNTQPDES